MLTLASQQQPLPCPLCPLSQISRFLLIHPPSTSPSTSKQHPTKNGKPDEKGRISICIAGHLSAYPCTRTIKSTVCKYVITLIFNRGLKQGQNRPKARGEEYREVISVQQPINQPKPSRHSPVRCMRVYLMYMYGGTVLYIWIYTYEYPDTTSLADAIGHPTLNTLPTHSNNQPPRLRSSLFLSCLFSACLSCISFPSVQSRPVIIPSFWVSLLSSHSSQFNSASIPSHRVFLSHSSHLGFNFTPSCFPSISSGAIVAILR